MVAPDSAAIADSLARADSAAAAAAAANARVEILWDTWGVPHVFARDAVALFYGLGRAQMRSHADLLLRLYGQARGRAAEYWGPEHLDSDRWVVTNGIPERARDWWGWQGVDIRAYLEAFAEGINAYARDHPDEVTDSLEVVLPVRPVDVLAHLHRVMHFTFVASPELVLGGARGWREPRGSNAWAVAPARSASGNALLLANPHLPWRDLYTWYESHLVSTGIDAYGAGLVGSPLPSIAFNDSLGWTLTVNTFDGADLFELRLVEGGYAWDAGVRALDSTVHVLKVKQPDGGLTEERLVVRSSVHGPVVAAKDSSALALRVVGLDQPHLVEQTWQMLRARNLSEFQTALARLQLPMFTVMYADRHGHILHVFNGQVPIRAGGDWGYWRGVVSGTRSSMIWTQYHAYRDLPRVLDPPAGWLQNANDAPWTTTIPFPLDPADYPPYMAPPPEMDLRAVRSARLLAEDERITFDELIAYKHSTRAEAADHLLEDVIHAARTHGGDAARRAAEVLERWDRQTDADSRGAILFQALVRELGRRDWPRGSLWDADWTPVAPLATPDGISDAGLAAQALEAAAVAVERTHGALDTPWGAVYRLRRDSVDLPANGGPGALGIFRVTGFERAEDGQFRANAGDSFIAVIEFATPVRARALLAYGNASQAGSPHRTDQLPLYAAKRLRDVFRSRAEVEQNLILREAF